jgi:flagellar hook-length control protein FliK
MPGATLTSAGPAPVLSYGVDLEQAIETVRATIELAARGGITQARIALEPAELGSIRIHLTQTSDGLVARVMAETPAAAQALAEGHAELRQSLSSLGVSLLRLDIGSFDQSAAHGGGHDSPGQPGGSPGPARSTEEGETESPECNPVTGDTTPARKLASGALVDVLA